MKFASAASSFAANGRPLHVLVVGGQSDSLTILRGDLIRALVARGHKVTTAAGQPNEDVLAKLSEWGVDFRHIPMERAGLNPLRDLATLWAMLRLMRRIKPDVVLGYQAKPANYAMIAAAISGVRRRIALITGLGYAFAEGGEWRRRTTNLIVRAVYRVGMRRAHHVIFQNEDDRTLFGQLKIVRPPTETSRVHGSGVDLKKYRRAPLPDGPPHFLMVARLLRDKGVYEFVEAARRVKMVHPSAKFTLAGPFDPNPAAVSREEVNEWVSAGLIEYGGFLSDVRPHLTNAHVIVLPTAYREGVPRILLEAMACGRPVIATNSPGCRDAVVDGHNGFLVPAKDASALAEAMLELGASRDLQIEFGSKGRARACRLFDVHSVSESIIATVECVTGAAPDRPYSAPGSAP